MKKVSLLLLLLLVFSICSCERESTQQNDHSHKRASVTTSVTDDKGAAVFSYEGVAKLHDSFQQCSSFLTAEMNYCKSMWSISKYSDDREVHDSFVNYLSKQSADVTISDSVSSLRKAVDLELDNCDPSLAPLLKTVSEKYSELADFLIHPSGTYREYTVSFDACFDEFVSAFDDMTSYLYDVGYYTE